MRARPSSPTPQAHQADAMGCQTKIVEKIIKKSADYVIALKKNQGNLSSEVEQIFKEAIAGRFEGMKASSHSTKQILRC